MASTPLHEAIKILAIQDIFMNAASSVASKKYLLGSPVLNPVVQFKINPTTDCEVRDMPAMENGMRYLVQYTIGTGIRILMPTAKPDENEPSDDEVIADLQATFVVRYLGKEMPTPEMLQAFNDNAIHHMWPYWREYIESTTIRLRVPTVILPMRVAGPPERGAETDGISISNKTAD